MDKLLEKLKGLVEDKDLVEIKEAYDKKLDEQVSLKLDEEKKKLELSFEESYKTKLEESIVAEKAKLDAEYDVKVSDLEKNLVEQLDSFLEAEINEKISEDLIEKSAINEALLPMVEAIKKIFEEQYVALDTEGSGLVKSKTVELEKRNSELSESIAKNMLYVEQLDTANKKLVLMEKTADLSENAKKRVYDLFEGKDLKYTTEKIDSFLQLVVERVEPVKANINENTDVVSADEKKEIKAVEVNKVEKPTSILIRAGEYL